MTELAITNFAGGVNLVEIPERIRDNELQDADNYLLAQDGSLDPRLGYDTVNTGGTPTGKNVLGTGVWFDPAGTESLLVRAGDQLYYLSGANTWTEIPKYNTYDFTTDASTTATTFSHSPTVPLYGTASYWTLYNTTTATPVLAAHNAVTTTTTATITDDGGSGVAGTVTLASGAVSLTTLTTSSSYQVRFYSYAFNTGGDRTSFCNFVGRLYMADGYNLVKWDGTTLTAVNINSNHYALPYYLCAHDNRLYAGKLRLKIDGTNYTSYPRSFTWSGVRDDTRWTPPNDTNICRIDLDYDVTAFASYGHLIIGTRRAIYYAVADSSLLGNYYFPSVNLHSQVGCLPFTMAAVDADVWWANEHGVWALSKTDKFGDMEKARLSYKIDPIFKTTMYTSGYNSLCGIYVPWRDEYWLSYPVSATQWDVVVGKKSIYDEYGRPPWMPLSFYTTTTQSSGKEWLVKPSAQEIYFTPQTGTYKLWKYGGYSDAGAVAFKQMAWTKEYGAQTRERKRLNWVTMHWQRIGSQAYNETANCYVMGSGEILKNLSFTYPAQAAGGYLWAATTAYTWGGGLWSGATVTEGTYFPPKMRVSVHARKFSLKFEFLSSLSGSSPLFANVDFKESER